MSSPFSFVLWHNLNGLSGTVATNYGPMHCMLAELSSSLLM